MCISILYHTTYLVFSMQDAVKEKAAPVWTRKKGVPEVTKSFQQYMMKQVLQDFAVSTCQVSEMGLADE